LCWGVHVGLAPPTRPRHIVYTIISPFGKRLGSDTISNRTPP